MKFLAVHANDVTYYAGSGFGIEITNPAGRQVPAKNGDPSGSRWQKQGANRWAILIFNRGEDKDGNYTPLSPAALNQENADVVRNLDPDRQVCVMVNDYDLSTNGGAFDLEPIRKEVESVESVVIPCVAPDSGGGASCGSRNIERRRTVVA